MTAMINSIVIRGGRVVDPQNNTDTRTDVWIENGLIRAIGPKIKCPLETPHFDATGLIVSPGWIDSHVHFREPGFENKETIATGSAAAASGGFTAVATMPNTQPPPDSVEGITNHFRRVENASVCIYPIACITAGRGGRTLAPLAKLAEAGAVAFSDDGDPVTKTQTMKNALEISESCGVPLFPHEEVKSLTAGGCMHEGEVSRRLGVKGMPAAGEEEMIARDIELVEHCGGHLHIAHISTRGTLELIRAAKRRGLAVTCEVLPHHFILTDEEVAVQGSAAKMSPPLREASDVAAMKEGLRDDTIDTIATDHAPHMEGEKKLPLSEAPFGIVGLETAVGLTFTHLVEPGILSLSQAIAKWTSEPARILKLPGGNFNLGSRGDVTLLDVNKSWTVNPEIFRSKSKNTPFAGWELTGKAVATIVAGRLIYNEISSRGINRDQQ